MPLDVDNHPCPLTCRLCYAEDGTAIWDAWTKQARPGRGINFHAPGDYEAALGLTRPQGEALFFPDNWSDEFQNRLARTRSGTPEYARVVADRIEDFIRRGE